MLGAYAPLPMRLQPGKLDNVSAEQYLRLCADLASVQRTTPLLVQVITFDYSTGTLLAVDELSRAANSIVGYGVLGGALTLNLTATWTDDLGTEHPVRITRATASYMGAIGMALPTVTYGADGLSVTITPTSAPVSSPYQIVVQIYTDEAVDPRVWGADDAKQNCTSESASVPLVAEMAEQIQLARGSSYDSAGTYVAAETLSLARWMAWLRRQTEAALVQRDPSHAADALPYWSRVLGMDPSLPDWELRSLMGSKWIRSMRGPGSIITQAGLDAALTEALGTAYLQTHHPADSIALGVWAPVEPEWWALSSASLDVRWDAQVGHWSTDLGDAIRGPWLSHRLHSTVELYKAPGTTAATWAAKIDAVDDTLETLAPAWVTWNACTDYATGFLVGTGILGETGLT